MKDVTICIFAKPPVPGLAKTRLIPAIGSAAAARVAQALLHDALQATGRLEHAHTVISTSALFDWPHCPVPMWLQPDGDLGSRIEAAMGRALAESRFAIALGADTPFLSSGLLENAVEQLRSFDAVLGPSEDGGYYLAGLRRCPKDLFCGVRWSNAATLEDTVNRFQRFRMTYSLLRPWFDLDSPDDLRRACSLPEAVLPDFRLGQVLRSLQRSA